MLRHSKKIIFFILSSCTTATMRILFFISLALLCVSFAIAEIWLTIRGCGADGAYSERMAITTSCTKLNKGWQYIDTTDTAAVFYACSDSECTSCRQTRSMKLLHCNSSLDWLAIEIITATADFFIEEWLQEGFGVSISYRSQNCTSPYQMFARPLDTCFTDTVSNSQAKDICDSKFYYTARYSDDQCLWKTSWEAIANGFCDQSRGYRMFVCPH